MTGIEIVGLGAMNIDRLYRVDEIVADGEQLVTDSEAVPGGSAANTIYGLAKLGVKTGFVGAVGRDEDGESAVGYHWTPIQFRGDQMHHYPRFFGVVLY
ncbi:Ribokinase [subsurface metagenome]